MVFNISDDLLVCSPFRTNILHSNSYIFRNTIRSRTNTGSAGIDFSKSIILTDETYLGFDATIDFDEYNHLRKRYVSIKNELMKYLNDYITHHKGISIIDIKRYKRKYQFSTLQYFHTLLGIF